jgi:hypothetical protein
MDKLEEIFRMQDALNKRASDLLSSRTTLGAAQIGRASAMDQLRYQAEIDARNRTQNREWQLADQDTQARASARSQFFGNMESAMFADPSIWRDPEGVIGAFNEYGSNFDTLFNNLFPEYSTTEGET